MTSKGRSGARRLWLIGALAVLLVAAGLIAALPWLLAWPRAQRWLAAEASRIMAPGRVEFRSLRLSWLHPTEVVDFVLRDAQGDRVLSAPRAAFQWNLRQILFAQPQGATLTFKNGDLDIERLPDGTVDLYETLKPIIEEYPRKRLVIRIEDGHLRYRDPVFPEPVVGDHAELMVDLSVGSSPISWKINMARNESQVERPQLAIEGNFSRAEVDAAGRHDFRVSLEGSRWPWTLANTVVQSRGDFSGRIDVQMRAGRLRLEGDATARDLVAIGDLLASDTIHLDRAHAVWTVHGDDDYWTLDRLEVTSPLGSLMGQGTLPPRPGHGAWLEGTVGLAPLSRQLPATLHLRDDVRVERGSARLRVDIQSDETGKTQNWKVAGNVSDLVARQGQKTLTLSEPATLSARLQKGENATKLEQFAVETPFLTASGSGDLDRGIAVTAALDLAVFRERFRDWIDLGEVELAGQGKLDARYQRRGQDFQAEASAVFHELRIGGLPLVGSVQRRELAFEGTVGGPAAPSGWPDDWQTATFSARSDPASGTIQALHDLTTRVLVLDCQAQIQRQLDSRRERIEGELKAKWDGRMWVGEHISLALIRDSKRGPSKGQHERIGWQGKGRYDPQADELVLESVSPRDKPPDAATWITGSQKARVSGLRSLGATQIEAAVECDLLSISRLLAPKDQEWSGQLDSLVHARREGDLWNLGARLKLNDLAQLAPDGSRLAIDGDFLLGVKANYAPGTDRLDLTEIGLRAPYVLVDGVGAIGDLTSRPDLDLQGSLSPDWKALTTLLAAKVEPRARIAGGSRAWRIAGTISGMPAVDRLGSLHGDFGVQIDELDVFGMRLSKVPVVLRAVDGRLVIDPIEARLNAGALFIEPELFRDKRGATWLRLGPATRLENAVINDEVSHRVLSYAAPVLDGATRVEGRVSLALAEAVFPLLAPPDAQALVKGDVLFDEVRFMPGPLAEQLLAVFQKQRKPLLVLRDPISVRIAGRKVYQEGLLIPVGDLASIGVEGTVDFDKNLDLVARFAMNPPRSNVPILSPILETARFELPIRGTLTNPRIDGEALKERWKAIGTGLLEGSVQAGVNSLQRLLQGLPEEGFPGLFPLRRQTAKPPPPQVVSPDRARPLTSEERQQLREERRQERLQKSGTPPQSGPATGMIPRFLLKERMTTQKRWRLSAMMALVYSVPGAFWPLLAVHLADLGIDGRTRGWIFATFALGSAAAPLGAGQLVDRLMPTQWFLALVYALGAGLLAVAASGAVAHAGWLFLLFLCYWCLIGPAYSLSNSLAMRNLEDPHREFGPVRLWGTAGWMASGWLVSLVMLGSGSTLAGQGAFEALWVATALSVVVAIYCIQLPHTPPLAVGPRGTKMVRQTIELVLQKDVAVLLIVSFGVYLTAPFVFQVIPGYLESRGLPRAWISSTMTLGQMTEIAMLAVLPLLLRRLGARGTLTLGISAWFIRFMILAIRPPLWLAVTGNLLHGVGFACFTVGGQVYIDSRSDTRLRASAQGALLVCTSGLGALLGSLLAGELTTRTRPDDVLVFLIPCMIDGALLLYFLRGFRAPVPSVAWAGAPNADPPSPPLTVRGSVARSGHLVTESADG